MKISRYIFASDAINGASDLIVCTDFPFIVGKAYMVEQEDIEEIERLNLMAANGKIAKCIGHSVYINIAKVLSGETVEENELYGVLKEMAEFFKEERLDKKPGKYRKYCENPKEIPSKEIREHYINLRHRRRGEKE